MQARPDLKVIVCSRYELDRDTQALLDARASSFRQKPFQKMDLAQAIPGALDSLR